MKCSYVISYTFSCYVLFIFPGMYSYSSTFVWKYFQWSDEKRKILSFFSFVQIFCEEILLHECVSFVCMVVYRYLCMVWYGIVCGIEWRKWYFFIESDIIAYLNLFRHFLSTYMCTYMVYLINKISNWFLGSIWKFNLFPFSHASNTATGWFGIYMYVQWVHVRTLHNIIHRRRHKSIDMVLRT